MSRLECTIESVLESRGTARACLNSRSSQSVWKRSSGSGLDPLRTLHRRNQRTGMPLHQQLGSRRARVCRHTPSFERAFPQRVHFEESRPTPTELSRSRAASDFHGADVHRGARGEGPRRDGLPADRLRRRDIQVYLARKHVSRGVAFRRARGAGITNGRRRGRKKKM